MAELSYDDFLKVEMRLGTILSAEPLQEARKPAYKLSLDFGPEIGIRASSAQITDFYTPQQLVGRQIVAVVNFSPKRIAGFKSECLVLGIYDQNDAVILLAPERPGPNGSRVF